MKLFLFVVQPNRNMSISEEKHFEVISEYFKNYGISYHQKESYNNLVNFTLKKIFEEEPDITIKPKKDQTYTIKIGQYNIDNPTILDSNSRIVRTIYPKEARLRDLTYESNVFVDIYTELTETDDFGKIKVLETNVYKRYPLFKIPVMVQSCKCNLYDMTKEEKIKAGECEYDEGGYFIIKGKERVIVGQERQAYNKVNVFKQKSISKYKYVAEMRSMSDQTGHSVSVQAKINNEGSVTLSLPYISQDIKAGIVFKAMGFSDDFISLCISKNTEDYDYDRIVTSIIRDSYHIVTKQEAIDYISTFVNQTDNKINYVVQILENEIFPHMGISSSYLERAITLGYMINKLILTYLKQRPCDDRDNISNKRVDMVGTLMGDLIRSLFKRLIKSLQNLKPGSRPDFISLIQKFKMTPKLLYCFSTGNWGIQKSSYIRKGVSQVLSRLTYTATLSHLRRLSISIGAEGKNAEIRQLHNTSIFLTCVTGDTEVLMGNNTLKKIKDLNPSLDIVMTVNPKTLEKEPSKIYNYFCKMPDKLLKVETLSGRSLKCTPEHPFLVYSTDRNMWVEASKLKAGDTLIIKDKYTTFVPVKRIDSIQLEPVYDFTTVSENHSFISNGIVTHNCPSETPEGARSGIVKNLAMMANVSIKIPTVYIKIIAENSSKFCKLRDTTDLKLIKTMTKIFLNGSIIGFTKDPKGYVKEIKESKSAFGNNPYSVIFDGEDVSIFCDEGRFLRPIFSLDEKGEMKIKDTDTCVWDDLLKTQKIEYIDSLEAEYSVLNMTSLDNNKGAEYTEIHPSMILGLCAGIIPYSDHSQSPRLCYSSSMMKQAIGIFALSSEVRADTVTHILHYPQKNITVTKTAELTGCQDLPCGVNAIVAILCYNGY